VHRLRLGPRQLHDRWYWDGKVAPPAQGRRAGVGHGAGLQAPPGVVAKIIAEALDNHLQGMLILDVV